jgi:hypothetical protein
MILIVFVISRFILLFFLFGRQLGHLESLDKGRL